MKDEVDVGALSRRYGPMVLRRCRQLLRNEDDALDACHTQALKPFVAVGLGPVLGASSGAFVGQTISSGNIARVTLGGFLGGGFDVHVQHSFSIGVSAGYNLMANFSEPVGLRDNFNGPEVAINLGWLFGAGK